jgi:N-acetylglucosaminyldiphosphoundecaprenol N-acetyl-beta-D-mannosaminyltransferase
MHTKKQNHKLLGVNISVYPIDQIVAQSIKAIESKSGQIHFTCANPHSLITAMSDKIFQNALNESEFIVADGSGVTIISKFLSEPTPPRITGHDYFSALLDTLDNRGSGRIFFFGSSEEVLSLIEKKFHEQYPNLEIAGTYSPPFGDWSDEKNRNMLDIINASNADVLWVGMTAPKQEKWVYKNRKHIDVPVIGSVGAVFDFFAGTQPRAPGWIRTIGMEWLVRIIREPKRMWRRNFVSTPLFIWHVITNHLFSLKK